MEKWRDAAGAKGSVPSAPSAPNAPGAFSAPGASGAPVLRKYGSGPFRVAVLHGGPGAPGGMAPVARELSTCCGILEPLLSSPSLAGQLQELHELFQAHAALPLTLVGHSWGAMLAFIFTAKNPAFPSCPGIAGAANIYHDGGYDPTGPCAQRLPPPNNLDFKLKGEITVEFVGTI